MRSVPRHEFVPADLADDAYHDGALPIGDGQTISQPYIVALMADAIRLTPSDRVLDVGTGSGYAAAMMAYIVDEVFTVERHESLLIEATEQFERLGITNISSKLALDDELGWPEEAPFDAISVAAASDDIPQELVEQLASGGRMVIPVGPRHRQNLVLVERRAEGVVETDLGAVAFVPLVTG